MIPGETIKAAKDLNTKTMFPVHSSKFTLAHHLWDEPLTKVAAIAKEENLHILTPMIGEIVNLKDSTQIFS